MTLAGIVIKNIIRKLLTGQDYRSRQPCIGCEYTLGFEQTTNG